MFNLKDDIKQFLDEFHANDVMSRGCNTSFITLIPKIDDPQNLGDFRFISLIGCMYKILAKILTSRLKAVLPGVIDKRQSAFLEERQLLMVANEVVKEIKRRKKKCLVFKVNYEKTYDSILGAFSCICSEGLALGESGLYGFNSVLCITPSFHYCRYTSRRILNIALLCYNLFVIIVIFIMLHYRSCLVLVHVSLYMHASCVLYLVIMILLLFVIVLYLTLILLLSLQLQCIVFGARVLDTLEKCPNLVLSFIYENFRKIMSYLELHSSV